MSYRIGKKNERNRKSRKPKQKYPTLKVITPHPSDDATHPLPRRPR